MFTLFYKNTKASHCLGTQAHIPSSDQPEFKMLHYLAPLPLYSTSPTMPLHAQTENICALPRTGARSTSYYVFANMMFAV